MPPDHASIMPIKEILNKNRDRFAGEAVQQLAFAMGCAQADCDPGLESAVGSDRFITGGRQAYPGWNSRRGSERLWFSPTFSMYYMWFALKRNSNCVQNVMLYIDNGGDVRRKPFAK